MISSNCSPSPPPVAFSMARLIVSSGMFSARARSIASRSLKLPSTSPPPALAATLSSRPIFVKTAPRLTSLTPFWRLICDHLECPDIGRSIAPAERPSRGPRPAARPPRGTKRRHAVLVRGHAPGYHGATAAGPLVRPLVLRDLKPPEDR